jgi:hypothetical protein
VIRLHGAVRAHLQLGVDRHREVGRKLEAFAHDGAEPFEREGHRVRARTEIDDLVVALRVGHDRLGLSISTGLAASTVTPGMTAPVASLTVPAIALCACAVAASSRKADAASADTAIDS